MSVVNWDDRDEKAITPAELCWSCIRQLSASFNTMHKVGRCTRCGFTTEIYRIEKDEVN
jgi:hypothetical protein